MCINLITHHTRCETRPQAIVDPELGLTVYNPFADPALCGCCSLGATSGRDAVDRSDCPAHERCCVREQRRLCFATDEDTRPCGTYLDFHYLHDGTKADSEASSYDKSVSDVQTISRPHDERGKGKNQATSNNTAEPPNGLRKRYFAIAEYLWRLRIKLRAIHDSGAPLMENPAVATHLNEWELANWAMRRLALDWRDYADAGVMEPFPLDPHYGRRGIGKYLQVSEVAGVARERKVARDRTVEEATARWLGDQRELEMKMRWMREKKAKRVQGQSPSEGDVECRVSVTQNLRNWACPLLHGEMPRDYFLKHMSSQAEPEPPRH